MYYEFRVLGFLGSGLRVGLPSFSQYFINKYSLNGSDVYSTVRTQRQSRSLSEKVACPNPQAYVAVSLGQSSKVLWAPLILPKPYTLNNGFNRRAMLDLGMHFKFHGDFGVSQNRDTFIRVPSHKGYSIFVYVVALYFAKLPLITKFNPT